MMHEVQQLMNRYDKISVVIPLNANGDAIATALGIYTFLKESKRRVEVVSATSALPVELDFLPNFSKIKNRMNYDESLIIVCGKETLDGMGLELKEREIINIDHHENNGHFGTINIVEPMSIALSYLVYTLFRDVYHISKEVATCFYSGILLATHSFTRSNLSREACEVISEIVGYGVDVSNVAKHLNQRRSLASLRILSLTLNSLELSHAGELGVVISNRESMLESGANVFDTVAILEHVISLVTVEIALIFIELEDTIQVSLRSKDVDVLELAISFGGGGHRNASGFEVSTLKIETLKTIIKKEIEKRGLLNA